MPLYISREAHQKSVLVVHIPKTAGITIRKGLNRNQYKITPLVGKYSWLNLQRKLKGIPLPGMHGKAKDYQRILGEKNWEKLFSFTFVRNPWDLMVSSYFYWLQIAKTKSQEDIRQQAEEIRRLGSFSNFINSPYGSEMINDEYGNIVDWITDEKDQIIVKFVGKFENLEADWQNICKILDFKDASLNHFNKSKHSHYRDYYDEQTKKLIERRFEWVIEHFKYQF